MPVLQRQFSKFPSRRRQMVTKMTSMWMQGHQYWQTFSSDLLLNRLRQINQVTSMKTTMSTTTKQRRVNAELVTQRMRQSKHLCSHG
jgi:carbohydrate-binding DOMON domain-containing protein